MDDKERADRLEDALAQLLQPLRNIPFSAVVKSLAKQAIIPINIADPADKDLVDRLETAAKAVGTELTVNPIIRARPNEVGNDVEQYVLRAAKSVGFECARPLTASGRLKSTGYPDIILTDAVKRPTYLECKIYGADKPHSSFRSFYVSPSDDFKVSCDARHLLLAFEMVAVQIAGTRNSSYTATAYKLVDLHDILCDVKYEFNSDNRRLYLTGSVLAEARLST